jgi:hypothetical protein
VILLDAHAYKSRAFKRARELIGEWGVRDHVGRDVIARALRDAFNEVLRGEYPAPRPAAGRSFGDIAADFTGYGPDPVDPELATLHASALRWIELGGGDPNDSTLTPRRSRTAFLVVGMDAGQPRRASEASPQRTVGSS